MRRIAGMVLLLVTALAVNGCGTMLNLADHPKVYGGSRLDGTSIARGVKEATHSDEAPKFTPEQQAAIIVYSLIDLPVSVVGDTLTLPVTIPACCYRWIKNGNKHAETASEEKATPEPAAPVPADHKAG